MLLPVEKKNILSDVSCKRYNYFRSVFVLLPGKANLGNTDSIIFIGNGVCDLALRWKGPESLPGIQRVKYYGKSNICLMSPLNPSTSSGYNDDIQ